jgi:hypothetical protein
MSERKYVEVLERNLQQAIKLLLDSSNLFNGRSYGKNAKDETIGRLWTAHAKQVDQFLLDLGESEL